MAQPCRCVDSGHKLRGRMGKTRTTSASARVGLAFQRTNRPALVHFTEDLLPNVPRMNSFIESNCLRGVAL